MRKGRGRRALAVALCAAMLATAAPAMAAAAAAEEAPSAADAAREQEWEELSGVLAGIYGEWKDAAYTGLFNNQIPDTALLGNGDIGVASGGDDVSKTFYISKSDFWEYNGSPLPIGGVTVAAPPSGGPTAAVSLAQGAAVSACCQHESFDPARVTSGQWSEGSGYEGWVSKVDTGHTHYLVIDFGGETAFDTVVLRHDGAARPAETENNTKGFVLAVSQDGEAFDDIYEETDNADSTSTVTLTQPVTARYLRVTITNPNQGNTGDSLNNPRARVGQVEVYNSRTQDLTVEAPVVSSAFYEKENLLDAQVETSQSINGQPLQMTTYTAAGRNLLVTELTAAGEQPVALRATVWAKADNSERKVTAEVADGVPVVTRSTKVQRGSDTAIYTSQAALALKVLGAETTALGTESAAGRAYAEFTVQPGQTVTLVTAVGGGGRTLDNWGKALEDKTPTAESLALLDTVADTTAAQALHAEHTAWWKEYWLESYILLDGNDSDLQTIQKYYYAAQYLLGCMCNEDGVAPGLYGIWHTTDTPSWNGDYHLNYNFIATFYGLFSSGRVRLSRSAVQQILDYVPQAQKNAASVNELKRLNADHVEKKIAEGAIDAKKGIEGGLLFPVGIGPYGMTLDNNYHNQGLNSTFSATMLINYYEYSGDEAFLEESLYDFLKGCAAFYEAWLDYDEETGKYTLCAGYNEGSWSTDPAAELAMLKCTLTHLLDYSEQLGRDADRREKWADMLANLAPQPTTTYSGKTVYSLAVQELKNGAWVDMQNPVPGDGNIIPMESVQPAGVIGYYSSDEELTIAHNTIDVFSSKGAWSQANNFPKIFPIAVNARYDAKTVTVRLASVIRSQMKANLRISDNTHGAEKCGTTQAVNNMLLLSDQGVIKLFGGWQSNKSAAFHRLCVAGGVSVSAAYDGRRGEVSTASLTCAKDSTLTVASLWEDMKVLDANGREVAAVRGSAPNHPDEATYTFAAQAGETYTLVKGEQASLVDKAALKAAIEEAIDPTPYTPESADTYRAALAQAQTVYADEDATQAQVDEALAALLEAGEGLCWLWGDVNHDGAVDTTDARLALQYAARRIGADKLDLTVADVNGDGRVDTTDARLILQRAARRISTFPVETR